MQPAPTFGHMAENSTLTEPLGEHLAIESFEEGIGEVERGEDGNVAKNSDNGQQRGVVVTKAISQDHGNQIQSRRADLGLGSRCLDEHMLHSDQARWGQHKPRDGKQ